MPPKPLVKTKRKLFTPNYEQIPDIIEKADEKRLNNFVDETLAVNISWPPNMLHLPDWMKPKQATHQRLNVIKNQEFEIPKIPQQKNTILPTTPKLTTPKLTPKLPTSTRSTAKKKSKTPFKRKIIIIISFFFCGV